MKHRIASVPIAQAWDRYEPSKDQPWNSARVAHLHRRAGFAASLEILERDLKNGPDAAVNRLLDGESRTADDLSPQEFDDRAEQMSRQLGSDLRSLQAVWLLRMIGSPRPLLERLTLFWHDHFATSFDKVNDANLMRQQNESLRKHALGGFEDLLIAMGKDAAMLVWLDASSNRKRKPNENYAREVMELFALGRGKYTEKDIQEAARAFTGRFVTSGEYHIIDSQHDDGSKTILGQTGAFDGDDVARILLKQPACAEFLCMKLALLFLTDSDPLFLELIAPLAKIFRDSGYQIRVAVETILRSRLFHDDSMRRRKIKGPVEFAVGLIRALKLVGPTVRLYDLAQSCEAMGQRLYAPPSVAGWDEGTAWINTTAMLVRSNLALALTGGGQLGRTSQGTEWQAKTGVKTAEDVAQFYMDLLVQDALSFEARTQVLKAAKSAGKTESQADLQAAAKATLAAIAASPEFQLA